MPSHHEKDEQRKEAHGRHEGRHRDIIEVAKLADADAAATREAAREAALAAYSQGGGVDQIATILAPAIDAYDAAVVANAATFAAAMVAADDDLQSELDDIESEDDDD